MKLSPVIFTSLSQLHKAMGQAPPMHPLISIINYGEATFEAKDFEQGIILDFYKISFKTRFTGKLKYGQGYYDFEEGGMSFIAPGQLLRMKDEEADYSGMSLNIHPDFFRSYPLDSKMKQYGFFGYSAAEALYLSAKEKTEIQAIYQIIQDELNQRIDKFSQDIIISQVELLLNYSNRYYERQFITRRSVNNEILNRLEVLLNRFFMEEQFLHKGILSVNDVAEHLGLTPRYLSDLLGVVTGQTTQQYIHAKVIDKAKEYLAKDILSVAEIAYHLGFEHPASFTRLFKMKTSQSPSDYKKSIIG
ncbi:MAG: AraC family transcriptional regulator [Sphingobacteriales bacterium]|nr:MAG: AraC family transcriptional regulator [Sphingobacteriales bacterium]